MTPESETAASTSIPDEPRNDRPNDLRSTASGRVSQSTETRPARCAIDSPDLSAAPPTSAPQNAE